MNINRDTEEFKIEPVKQVTERGNPAPEVAKRLGARNTPSMWIRNLNDSESTHYRS